MRLHGTLTKWNDERGFGFITPARGPPDVFVHISAFPSEGGRPQLRELISFEIEPSPDGKQRAVRIMRAGQPASRRPGTTRDRRAKKTWLFGSAPGLLALAVAGMYAYGHFRERSVSETRLQAPDQSASSSPRYSCDGRTRCSQMTSCDEAKYFLRNCPNTQMDGDGDGEPCESQWCD
jgi:cold shock CspA family protein